MSLAPSQPSRSGSEFDPTAIRDELARVAGSPTFENAERLQRFLTFVVEETLQGRGERLKESVIGVEVFGRPPSYDPRADPIVRVQARRLRSKLDQHYRTASGDGGVRIQLPKGGYEPEFGPPAAVESRAEPRSDPAAVEAPGRQRPRRPHRKLIAAVSAAAVIAVAIVVVLRANRPEAGTERIFAAYGGYQTTPSFSPDGMTVAFGWGGENDDNPDIYVQRVDADSPRRITTMAAAERNPAWLPDGQHLSFLREEDPGRMSIVVVPLLGGGERVVAKIQANADDPPTIAWAPAGNRIYTSERSNSAAPLQVVEISVESGARRILTRPPAGTPGDDEVALSPDGKTLAFRRVAESSINDVFTIPVTGGSERAVTRDRRGVIGLAWTRDGKALIVSSRRQNSLQSLWRFPLEGNDASRLTEPAEAASYPTVSPRDGSIAYASRFLDANIWRIDTDGRESARRLIASNLLDTCPRYSPDGNRIAFRSNRTGNDELWVAGADGGVPARLTDFGGPVTGCARWSPDGQTLAVDARSYGNADVFLIPAGGGRPRRMTYEKSNEVLPSFSADGKFVYFASDRSATWQVWRQPVGGGAAEQMTHDGGFAPLASPDGRWLYYTKHSRDGLFRMEVSGGREQQVIGALASSNWGGWGVANENLYYLASSSNHDGPRQLMIYSPATGKERPAALLQFPPVLWDGSLGVAADGRYALVAEVERAGSEIRLRAGR